MLVFFPVHVLHKKSAEPWVHVLANRGYNYCSSKYFCGLGCFIAAYTHIHTHIYLHTGLISLISLSGSAVTPSCLGQTWSSLPAFRSLGMVAVWLCLDWSLTSLLRTTTPPLSTTATVSLLPSPSSPSDQLSTCHSHLASTLAPVVSSSWFSSPLPATISPWCV